MQRKGTLLGIFLVFLMTSVIETETSKLPKHVKKVLEYGSTDRINWAETFGKRNEIKDDVGKSSEYDGLMKRQDFVVLTPGVTATGNGNDQSPYFYVINVDPFTFPVLTFGSEDNSANSIYIGSDPSNFPQTFSTSGGITEEKLAFACNPSAYYIVVFPSGAFNLTANLESLVVDAPALQTFIGLADRDYYTFEVANDCSNITVFVESDGNLQGITLADSCSAFNGGDLCAPVDSTSTGFQDSDLDFTNPKRYYLVQGTCLPAGDYVLAVRYLGGSPNSPYNVTVVSSNSPCSVPDCSGSGVCFQGNCFCQNPFTGTGCQSVDNAQAIPLPFAGVIPPGSSYFYISLDRSQVQNSNLVFSVSSSPLNDGDPFAVNIQLTKNGSTLWNDGNSGSSELTFYHEVCSSAATGLLLLRIDNQFYNQPINVDISTSLVDRTISDPSTFTNPSFPTSDSLSVVALYYRLQAPVSPQLLATIFGNTGLFGLALVDQNNCAFVETNTNVRGVSDFQGTGPRRSVYQVGFRDCFQEDPQLDYYIAVEGSGSSETSYTLDVNGNPQPCPYGCANGVCGSNGQCICFDGFNGTYCQSSVTAHALLGQTVSGQIAPHSSLTYTLNVNSPMDILVLSQNSSTSIITVSRDPNGSPVLDAGSNYYCSNMASGTYYVTVTNDADTTDNFNFRVDEVSSPIAPNTVVRSIIVPNDHIRVYSFDLAPTQQAHIQLSYPRNTFDFNLVQFEVSNSDCVSGFSQTPTTSGPTFATADIFGCTPGRYYISIYSNEFDRISPKFNFSLIVNVTEATDICPNCCSNIGTCNFDAESPVCVCPPGYSGPDCATPDCVAYDNPFCGVQGPFTFNPLLALTFQSIQDAEGCDIQTIVSNFDASLGNLPVNDSCTLAIAKATCQRAFLPCNNGVIQTPCRSDCINTLQPCSCGSNDRANSICTGMDSDFPVSPYLDDVPHTTCPTYTTGFVVPITSNAVTSSKLTTSQVTSAAVSTAAVTSASVTTAAVTSASVSTGRITTSVVTTSRVTTSRVTTGILTTGASAQSVCSNYNFNTPQGYFCNAQQTGFYQCLKGAFASQSAFQQCPAGTHCECPVGVECSHGNTQSPCGF